MSGERECVPGVAAGRLARAEAFFEAADLVAGLIAGDEQAETSLSAALVTLWVLAGIAAADAICCKALGRHHYGDNHQGALMLLRDADKDSVASLDRLLDLKTSAGYGYRMVSAKDRTQARRSAEQLLRRAQQI